MRWVILVLILLVGCQTQVPTVERNNSVTNTSLPAPKATPQEQAPSPELIRYVAVGDSYTIGEGVSEEDRWPNVLTQHLQEEGIRIELIANPSATGRQTQGAIDRGLPVFREKNATFGTLLIGVNDWVNLIPEETFRTRFVTLLDAMLEQVGTNRLVVLTIPDFSATPQGQRYSAGRNITEGIAGYNAIIEEEAHKRGVAVVDLFELSQGMRYNRTLVASDGLHPSAKEYLLWEQELFPVVYGLLKE